MTELLQRILPTVQKPARYTGGEYNEIIKDKQDIRVRVAFCFPDTYEIGMSNVGMRILYGVMNRMDGVWCERVFAPWGDMEDEMRQHGLPLWALESQDPVRDFDMIAFTIGYEMAYSNILNMLNLAGIPLHSSDRTDLKNIVFAGGVCAFNPEPLADFIDFFSLGEGEESTVEIVSLYDRAKAEGWSKAPVCIAKTQYSFSDDPKALGAPAGFGLTIRQVRLSAGAGFIVAFAGDIIAMPGLPKAPAALQIDVAEDGRITGLF